MNAPTILNHPSAGKKPAFPAEHGHVSEWAIWYASTGLKVIPCEPATKVPIGALVKHGHLDASNDHELVAGWWRKRPDAMIGCPCGENGLVVIDLDVDEAKELDGHASFAALEAIHGEIFLDAIATTPRGGSHFYFKAPTGCTVKNSASKLGPGIDLRAAGGYVILPPSRRNDNRDYKWVNLPLGIEQLTDLPHWLLARAMERKEGRATQTTKLATCPTLAAPYAPGTIGAGRRAYAEGALRDEAAAVADTGEGGRNDRLNIASKALGNFVHDGVLDEVEVRSVLFEASEANGAVNDDGANQAHNTISSGLAAGKKEGVRWPAHLQGDSAGPLVRPSAAASVQRSSSEPLPLFQDAPAGCEFPVAALGPLAAGARAIAHKNQLPLAMAGSSVLAAAALAAQAHVDVQMPYGSIRPSALAFVSVASSGDRKSRSDEEAMRPIVRREMVLREAHAEDMRVWRAKVAAWTSQRKHIEANKRMSLEERTAALTAIGDEPERPLHPMLTTGDVTPDGLTKNWPWAHGALGVFTAEGATFTAGHGMSDDAKGRTAAILSQLWDGSTIKRLRAGDGVTILAGRRLSFHLMIQRDLAATFFSDPVLRDQGFLSRILVCAPESLAGTRFYRPPDADDERDIAAYGAMILVLLEMPPPLVEGTRNELSPRPLLLSAEAETTWIAYFNHVEGQIGASEEVRALQDVASKAAENAARIAAVLAVVENPKAQEITEAEMRNGCELMDFYLSEALRLRGAGRTDPKLLQAQRLLDWMNARTALPVRVRDMLQRGPGALREKAKLDAAIAILLDHGLIKQASNTPRAYIPTE